MKRGLTFDKDRFYLDEKPFRILSGSIHYFRVVPQYWEDRLLKLKQCGFNTVTTYTCWNLHEREEGVFDFQGMLDLERFLETAQRLGLYVILRPGPYICAEWEMGGLPSWLLKEPGMRLRCTHKGYLDKASRYLREVLGRVEPYLYEKGGPVIAVQLENEYGSYGNDTDYLNTLAQLYQECGIDCLIFTSDGPGYFMLTAGSLPQYLAAVNFGSNPKDSFELLKKLRPNQPCFCAEYWNGWFDHWYGKHHAREASDTAKVFREMLQMGASVNFYMFHGGTNFGFLNGANYGEYLEPTTTSYDYNAPLSESGDLTEKYYEIRQEIERFSGPLEPLTVTNLPKHSYGQVVFEECSPLLKQLDHLAKCVKSPYPLTMEEIGVDFGFLLYRTYLEGPMEELELFIDGLADRAIVFLEGKRIGIKENTGKRDDRILFGLEEGQVAVLEILVENLGRVNYGGHILDGKGILRGVRVSNRYLFGWEHYPLTLEQLQGLSWKPCNNQMPEIDDFKPMFFKGYFQAEVCQDTFIKPEGFKKGCVWVNGFALGRYWQEAGPQKTLYLPGPILQKGKNEMIILELDGTVKGTQGGPWCILTDKEEL